MNLPSLLFLRSLALSCCSLILVSFLPSVESSTVTAAQYAEREFNLTSDANNGPKPAVAQDTAPEPSDVLVIVELILDENASDKSRREAIADNPDLAADLITLIVSDMKAGTKEENRRIPWIWQVAFQAGKSNDAEQIGRVLDVSLPAQDEGLAGWQAVVVGGGIINGLSEQGIWPQARIAEILADDTLLQAKWHRAIRLAERIIVDKSIPTGTRYHALRIIAMDNWQTCQSVLVEYLAKGTEDELQLGAVSGLVDVAEAGAAKMLLSSLADLTPGNRELAMAGLMRGEERTMMMLDAVEKGTVKAEWLNEKQINALRSHESEAIKQKAVRLFPLASVNRMQAYPRRANAASHNGPLLKRMATGNLVSNWLRNGISQLQADRAQSALVFQFEFYRFRFRRENLQ